jgi:two-component system chemotaxis response regulator CheB
VVGHASNGKIALSRMETGQVDVLTLDLEMPVMGGLEVLKHLQAKRPEVGAIVVSALSQQGARQSIEAMRLGAFDLITKPNAGGNLDEVIKSLKQQLVPLVLACGDFIVRRRSGGRGSSTMGAPLPSRGHKRVPPGQVAGQRGAPGRPSIGRPLKQPVEAEQPPAALPVGRPSPPEFRSVIAKSCMPPVLMVIGSSTGGPQALEAVLSRLPGDLPVPVLIVQHMPPMFTKTLAESLDKKCPLKVQEATHGQLVRKGEVLIAPGGHQMKIRRVGTEFRVQITDDPPERSCRPSVDYLFRSASMISGGRTVAAVLTGMGDDGTAGARLLQAKGAYIVAQDEESSVVFGMPKLLVNEGIAHAVLPLTKIAAELTASCRRGAKR